MNDKEFLMVYFQKITHLGKRIFESLFSLMRPVVTRNPLFFPCQCTLAMISWTEVECTNTLSHLLREAGCLGYRVKSGRTESSIPGYEVTAVIFPAIPRLGGSGIVRTGDGDGVYRLPVGDTFHPVGRTVIFIHLDEVMLGMHHAYGR